MKVLIILMFMFLISFICAIITGIKLKKAKRG